MELHVLRKLWLWAEEKVTREEMVNKLLPAETNTKDRVA
jgi:hypothetical protein